MNVRHRPKSFDEVVGNDALKKSLQNLNSNVIMFEGQRGCGKTTLSKIITKEFTGNENSIQFVNCGDKRKIDDIRAVINELRKPSIFSDRKAYILDEIHKLTDDAKSSLLTELEDTLPKYVMIIACTTEPERVMLTLLDRFSRYRVSTLNVHECVELIDRICTKKKISIPKWMKVILIESSEGNPRILLDGLDRIKNVDNEQEARYLLELTKLEDISEDSINLFKMLYSGECEWKSINKTLSSILSKKKPDEVRVDLLNILSSRVTSYYFKHSEEEVDKVAKMYEHLSNRLEYPEKANFVISMLFLNNLMKG